MPALRIVNVERRLGLSAAQLTADLGLREADAVYVALAQQLKVPLITWDQEQIDRTNAIATTLHRDISSNSEAEMSSG